MDIEESLRGVNSLEHELNTQSSVWGELQLFSCMALLYRFGLLFATRIEAYSRIVSTTVPASGAGNVSEPRLI